MYRIIHSLRRIDKLRRRRNLEFQKIPISGKFLRILEIPECSLKCNEFEESSPTFSSLLRISIKHHH
jgi:hypothetical protein